MSKQNKRIMKTMKKEIEQQIASIAKQVHMFETIMDARFNAEIGMLKQKVYSINNEQQPFVPFEPEKNTQESIYEIAFVRYTETCNKEKMVIYKFPMPFLSTQANGNGFKNTTHIKNDHIQFPKSLEEEFKYILIPVFAYIFEAGQVFGEKEFFNQITFTSVSIKDEFQKYKSKFTDNGTFIFPKVYIQEKDSVKRILTVETNNVISKEMRDKTLYIAKNVFDSGRWFTREKLKNFFDEIPDMSK